MPKNGLLMLSSRVVPVVWEKIAVGVEKYTSFFGILFFYAIFAVQSGGHARCRARHIINKTKAFCF